MVISRSIDQPKKLILGEILGGILIYKQQMANKIMAIKILTDRVVIEFLI